MGRTLPPPAIPKSSRRAAPPSAPAKRPGRQAPPPPKPELPAWHIHDPYNQPGEPPSAGFIPNPPEYCDAPWTKGPSGVEWCCTAFCNSCPDRKVCAGLKGYHAATTAKNNGHSAKKEWQNDDEEN